MHTTSSRPIPTRRHNPCQICGDIKGKCREAGDLLLCMNITDAYSAPSEFKFLGLTKNSLWGKFVVRNKQEISFEERSERRRQREATKKAEQEARAKTALSLSERDQATRTLHKHLGLSTKHRQELQNRGLNDATIDAGYFFSVAPGDDLPFGIPANYPGAKNGKLSVAGTGFACPAWSVNGEVIGWQLRLDDATDNKYRWAKGNVSSHLANGELPITVVRPSELKHQWLAEAEGILKPYITAQKLGAVCIGAAGGNITASPEQFKQAIASLGVTEIRDFPDAGDVCNNQVMHRRVAKYEFYRSLGLSVKIGWWNQITKEQRDIDELPTLDGIRYISVDEFLAIARQHGFKLSARQTVQQRDEFAEFYAKRVEELEQWEENCDCPEGSGLKPNRHIELQQEESFKSFFTNRLEKLKKFLNRTRPFKGFVQQRVAQNKPGSGIIEFTKSDHLATIQALAQQAASENKRLIVLDSSEGGTGKSHLAGELTPQALGVNKIFYTSPSHRNPTVASIEQNYTDLPVRHDGLVSDDTQLTPLGNPYVRWAKPGEEPNVQGNCSKAHQFQTFGEKGYKEEVSAEAAHNSICNVMCKWKSNCAGAAYLPTMPRHTFRQDRRNALASDRIRCNLDSLPDIAKMQGNPEDENQEPNRVAVVVDEFTQFRGYSETQANLSDFDNAWMYFKSQVHQAETRIKQLTDQQKHLQAQIDIKLAQSEKLETQLEAITTQQHLDLGRLTANNNTELVQQLESEIARLDAEAGELIQNVLQISEEIDAVKKNTELLPGAIAALEPVIFALRSILNGEHDITSETRYGWNEAAVRGLLGDLTGLEQHLAVIRAFNPKLAALLKESDSVTLDGMSTEDRKGCAPILKATRKLMQREVNKENREALANMPSNCIVPLLEILLGEKQGSFRIAYKDLTIFTRDDRHRNQLKQADFTLILDGTLTRESLAQALDVDPSEIVVIRQKRSSHANLKIVQVTGMGLLGRDRSESMKQRVKAITNAILEQHGEENVGVIDHAACIGSTAEEAESGYWFHDNRGSNAFQNKTALLTFGTPFSNIGQLQLEYTTLTGDRNPSKDNAQFAAFVQERVQSEVAQCGWRLRSSRREGEQLIWYVVTDENLSYLGEYFPDSELEIRCAFQLTPEAGSVGEQTYWTILQASKQLTDAGQKLTTGAIAQIVGCNRSRISQIAKDVVGGFAAFQRVLVFLLKSLYRRTNTPVSDGETLSEDELFAAKTYLPLTLEENASTPEEGIKEVLSTAQTLGEESFRRVLALLRWEDRALLLTQMVAVLPVELQEDFLKLGKLLEEQVASQAIATA
ncbi:hypothetical protein [Scytonema sp. PCC 10023]|uniref:hypothetical protein n=1 Tax=Scytonema sp. PCC 10023 TaxID=1680591 RepID=UPI0039C62B1C